MDSLGFFDKSQAEDALASISPIEKHHGGDIDSKFKSWLTTKLVGTSSEIPGNSSPEKRELFWVPVNFSWIFSKGWRLVTSFPIGVL